MGEWLNKVYLHNEVLHTYKKWEGFLWTDCYWVVSRVCILLGEVQINFYMLRFM